MAFVNMGRHGYGENAYKEIVELLLKAGANVHARNDEALIYAAGNGHKEIANILIEAGASF